MQKAIVQDQGVALFPGPAAHHLDTPTVEKQKGRESSFAGTAATIVTGVGGLVVGHGLQAPEADRVLHEYLTVYFANVQRWC